MPFYTQSANSFADVRNALFSACTANGWTLSGEILTKGSAVVRVELNTVSTAAKGAGLILRCGTGVSGGVVTGASPVGPRFGPLSPSVDAIVWPMQVDIHVHDNEVYLIGVYNVDTLLFLAFGISSLPISTGMWATASTYQEQGLNTLSIAMTPTSGGGANSYRVAPAPFWTTAYSTASSASLNNDTICANIDGIVWAGLPTSAGSMTSPGAMYAVPALAPLMARQPNAWNSEAVLLRIQVYMARTNATKISLILDLLHARYVRVDNYQIGQIITLGPDRWKVYPAYRKNAVVRDGGTDLNHSGTFGWAVRYDGP